MSKSLADRVYALSEKTGIDTATIMDTYVQRESKIYHRDMLKVRGYSFEDHTLKIMERYASIKQANKK